MNSSTSTPALTRKIAASTNESAPNALTESLTKCPALVSNAFFSYQGRNIEKSSSSAAPAARRWSGPSARHARAMRAIMP